MGLTLIFLVIDAVLEDDREQPPLVIDGCITRGQLPENSAKPAGTLYEGMLRAGPPSQQRSPCSTLLIRAPSLLDAQGFMTLMHRLAGGQFQRRISSPQADPWRKWLYVGHPELTVPAAQTAVAAAGGGVCRGELTRRALHQPKDSTTQARVQPAFEGKPEVFDAFTSHDDEITELATAFGFDDRLVGIQVTRSCRPRLLVCAYHPEHDRRAYGGLCRWTPKLIPAGVAPLDESTARAYIDDHRTPAMTRAP